MKVWVFIGDDYTEGPDMRISVHKTRESAEEAYEKFTGRSYKHRYADEDVDEGFYVEILEKEVLD